MNAILEAIRDASFGRPGLRCLRLFQVRCDAFAELREEVKRICQRGQPSNVGEEGHITNWTRPRGKAVQYSLLNASGRFEDFSTDHDHSCLGKHFTHGTEYPALARFIGAFCHMVNFRINVLGPYARLSVHKENSVFKTRVGTAAICARFHLPVLTDARTAMLLDGDVFHLDPGTVYFVNHGCVHDARNDSACDRVHLVWDTLLTQAAFETMFGAVEMQQGLLRITSDERAVLPLRTERIGAVLKFPDIVTPQEADNLGWSEVQ